MERLGAGDAHRTDDVRSVATGDLSRHDVERRVVVDDLEHELDVVVRLVERVHDRFLGRDLGRVIARAQAAEPMDLDDSPATGSLAAGSLRPGSSDWPVCPPQAARTRARIARTEPKRRTVLRMYDASNWV